MKKTQRTGLWRNVVVAFAVEALLAFGGAARADWVDNFDQATFDARWAQDVPDPALASISLDTANDWAHFAAMGNTDMWTTRNNAPILWTAAPTGSYYIETHVMMPTTQNFSVAGLTVYGDGIGSDDGEKPNFSFGLDHWSNTNRMVKLQGLGTNNPNISQPATGGEAWLRLEVYPGGGAGGVDRYVARYKLQEPDPWSGLAYLDRDVDNARMGLVLKTGGDARHADFSYAASGAAAPPAPGPGELWSVDIQGAGGATFVGVEPNYGYGQLWNAFNVAHHPGTSTNPSMALMDSVGNPTDVTFSILGTVSGYNNPGALTGDYLFVRAGNADREVDWEISGLIPNGVYELYAYGGVGRSILLTVDDISQTATVSAAGFLFADIMVGLDGKMTGTAAGFDQGDPEGNWSGFQLRLTSEPGEVPEPATLAMLALAAGGLAGYVRRRKRRKGGARMGVLGGLVAVLALGGAAQAAALLGFYPLDGDGTDPTGTGPTLLTPANPVIYFPGGGGLAASFDGTGSSYLRANINASGDVNPTFSWGAWVKLNAPAAWNIFLSNDNGGWDRFTQVNSSRWSVSDGGVVQSPHPTSTDWTFIAHTFDGTNQHLYVDNLPVFTRNDPAQPSQTFIDIGRNANGAYPLNGMMDGVFFFDDTLTQAEVDTIRNGGPTGAGVYQVAGVPDPSSYTAIAQLRADYDAHTPVGGVASQAANIADTQGNGRWSFYSSTTENPTAGGSNLTDLVFDTAASGVRTANAYADPGTQPYTLPGISNTQLISGGAEGAPAANQVALHPGEQSALRQYMVTRWTAGPGEAGAINVTGHIHDIGLADDHITFAVFDDAGGVLIPSQIVDTTLEPFSFDTTVAVGDDLWFVVGNQGNYYSDQSALSITIRKLEGEVPEPATLAMLALAAGGLAGYVRRRRAA